MSGDLVKQSIAELQDLVRCRCHPAYTGRGLHDPDCDCDSADAVQVVVDHIEELEAKAMKASNAAFLQKRRADDAEAKLEAVIAARDMMGRMWAEAEAKLAKAVDALGKIDRQPDYRLPSPQEIARTTLAELKGETDD